MNLIKLLGVPKGMTVSEYVSKCIVEISSFKTYPVNPKSPEAKIKTD